MLSNIKKYADNSETLKEARKNVKEMSLAKEIVVFIALFALIFFGTMLLNTILPVIYMLEISHGTDDNFAKLLGLYGLIVTPIIIYFIVTRLEKRSWRSVGVSKGDVISSCLRGLLIGFIMFFTVVIIGLALGQYKYDGIDSSSIIILIPFFFGFLIQSFGEEFHERGWALTFISKRHSVIIAILISSIAFSATHLLNRGIDPLSLLNIVLVGIFFAVLFLKYDNIWVCGCAHAAWNFSQGALLGFNVSGNTIPSFLKFSQVSQNLIGGGKFGPESSLIATFVILIALLVAVYYTRK